LSPTNPATHRLALLDHWPPHGHGTLALDYAEYAYVTRPGSLPGALLAAWYQWWWLPLFALILVFTPLLFPTGRLLSARWRPVAVAAAVATGLIAVGGALEPTLKLENEDYTVRNPIGLTVVPDEEAGLLGAVLFGVLAFSAVAALVSLVLRFRRSRGVERQQLKWFTYAVALAILFQLVTDALPEGTSTVRDVLFGLTVAFIPIAAGIAILRYRLYDIDRLINLTLVYGLLTVLLGGIYGGAVLVLGQVFGGVGRDPPSWVVAGATLAVAALFQPARRRIQGPWIGASTAASTTPPRSSRRSALASAMRSTWTRSRPRCWRWSTRRCSQQSRPYGCDPRHRPARVVQDKDAEPGRRGLTPCRPCRFGRLRWSRSAACAQHRGSLEATVSVATCRS
jgi:hypothetical protein